MKIRVNCTLFREDSLTIEERCGHLHGSGVRGEGEEVDAGVDGGGEQHEEPQLLPHPQPVVEPSRKGGVLGAPGVTGKQVIIRKGVNRFTDFVLFCFSINVNAFSPG